MSTRHLFGVRVAPLCAGPAFLSANAKALFISPPWSSFVPSVVMRTPVLYIWKEDREGRPGIMAPNNKPVKTHGWRIFTWTISAKTQKAPNSARVTRAAHPIAKPVHPRCSRCCEQTCLVQLERGPVCSRIVSHVVVLNGKKEDWSSPESFCTKSSRHAMTIFIQHCCSEMRAGPQRA